MKDDIRRIDDFVQLSVDTARSTLCVDRLVIVGMRLCFSHGRGKRFCRQSIRD